MQFYFIERLNPHTMRNISGKLHHSVIKTESLAFNLPYLTSRLVYQISVSVSIYVPDPPVLQHTWLVLRCYVIYHGIVQLSWICKLAIGVNIAQRIVKAICI